MTLVTFQLRGRADKWWRTWKKGLASNASPIGWKEFQKDFRDQFIPRSMGEAWMREFETLRQGACIVNEYDALFVSLSEYAPHMIPDEDEKIRRFVEDLRDSLFSEVRFRTHRHFHLRKLTRILLKLSMCWTNMWVPR